MLRKPSAGGPCSAATRSGWCGLCYENLRGRASHKGHRWYVAKRARHASWEDFTIKRPSGVSRPKGGTFTFADSDWLSTWPLLCAGLGDPWWDDGKPREPWTMKLSFGPDSVLCQLTDKDNKLVSFTTAEDFKACLDKIEEALQADSLSWRKSKY